MTAFPKIKKRNRNDIVNLVGSKLTIPPSTSSFLCLLTQSLQRKKKQQEIYVGESRGTPAAEADIRFFSPTVFDSRDGLRRNRETARGLI